MIVYDRNGVRIYHGCCLSVLAGVPSNEFDAIVTDPPAGISFMGKAWDGSRGGRDRWVEWMCSVATECLRVCKPGAHAVVWSLPRTSHWTGMAWENAGWEVRDKVYHAFGSGFPKSLDVSKAIDKEAGEVRESVPIGNPVKRMIPGADQHKTGSWIKDNGRTYQPVREIPSTSMAKQWEGWGTNLKPAVEEWWLLRKPLDCDTVAANVLKWGTGALNIDASRVPFEAGGSVASNPSLRDSVSGGNGGHIFSSEPERRYYEANASGRFPANLVHDGSECVVSLFPHTASGKQCEHGHVRNADKTRNAYGDFTGQRVEGDVLYGDEGSAARFFYCAKASRADRGDGNTHPTVKPQSLMRYLVRMVTPPGGVVLDPFLGSGTTALAARELGFRCVGIEECDEYVTIAESRLFQRQSVLQFTE